ncbi:hypothetical protein DRN73_08130 [Candidatus Pacearchaeota archaeon]|nr:MAG: hypothetical protein DRN73_08130 [Candidatus Pacearchaeota archaeon]
MAKVCKCLKTEKMKIELEGLEELTDIELGEVEKEIEPETSYEGIVVDEFKAETTPCYHIKGTNLYYSKGIIGALTQEQVRKYCRLGVQEIERPKIVERIETFKKAAEYCWRLAKEKAKKEGLTSEEKIKYAIKCIEEEASKKEEK